MTDAMDQLMRDKIADSLKDFHLWTDMIRSGEAEVTGLTIKRKPKEWVGLTQQDIDIAFDDTQEGGGFDDFARAIEAKLREKNNE